MLARLNSNIHPFVHRRWSLWVFRALRMGAFDMHPAGLAQVITWVERFVMLKSRDYHGYAVPEDPADLKQRTPEFARLLRIKIWDNGSREVIANPHKYAFDAVTQSIVQITPQLEIFVNKNMRVYSQPEFQHWWAVAQNDEPLITMQDERKARLEEIMQRVPKQKLHLYDGVERYTGQATREEMARDMDPVFAVRDLHYTYISGHCSEQLEMYAALTLYGDPRVLQLIWKARLRRSNAVWGLIQAILAHTPINPGNVSAREILKRLLSELPRPGMSWYPPLLSTLNPAIRREDMRHMFFDPTHIEGLHDAKMPETQAVLDLIALSADRSYPLDLRFQRAFSVAAPLINRYVNLRKRPRDNNNNRQLVPFLPSTYILIRFSPREGLQDGTHEMKRAIDFNDNAEKYIQLMRTQLEAFREHVHAWLFVIHEDAQWYEINIQSGDFVDDGARYRPDFPDASNYFRLHRRHNEVASLFVVMWKDVNQIRDVWEWMNVPRAYRILEEDREAWELPAAAATEAVGMPRVTHAGVFRSYVFKRYLELDPPPQDVQPPSIYAHGHTRGSQTTVVAHFERAAPLLVLPYV